MRNSVYIFASLMVAVALLIPSPTIARESQWPHSHQHGHNNHGQRELKPARPRTNNPSSSNIAEPSDSEGEMMEERNAHPLQIAGSRLPDCSHACGSCSPCKLVIVSSLCAALSQAAETCPVSYRCMCNNKSYPVP